MGLTYTLLLAELCTPVRPRSEPVTLELQNFKSLARLKSLEFPMSHQLRQ